MYILLQEPSPIVFFYGRGEKKKIGIRLSFFLLVVARWGMEVWLSPLCLQVLQSW